MNFFKTILAVCSGPSIFPELLGRSPFKALFHLFLFCLLLAFLIAGFKIFDMREECKILTNELGNYFGNMTISGKGVLPSKHPDEPKTFLLTDELRLDYLTLKSLPDLNKMNQWTQNSGIFWTQRGFLFWKRHPEEKSFYMLIPLPQPTVHYTETLVSLDMMTSAKLTSQKIQEYLETHSFIKPGEKFPAAMELIMTPKEIAYNILAVIAVFLISGAFLGLFFLSFVTTILFALAQSLFTSKMEKRLKFKPILTVMVYAAFPALLLTALAMIFSFPLFSFQTIFFIVFFIYQLLAFSAIQRFLNPPPEKDKNENDGDDDFF